MHNKQMDADFFETMHKVERIVTRELESQSKNTDILETIRNEN